MTTLSAQIVRRLCVPCTQAELSSLIGKPPKVVCAMLHQLKRQGRVKPLDRYVGRQRCWQAAGTADEIHELHIQDCYDRWLEGEAKWPELTALIAQRSPEQVRRMEKERGLA